jgi:hypothetical protein
MRAFHSATAGTDRGHSDYWPNPATSGMAARFFGIVADNAIQRSYIPEYVATPANKIAKNKF